MTSYFFFNKKKSILIPTPKSQHVQVPSNHTSHLNLEKKFGWHIKYFELEKVSQSPSPRPLSQVNQHWLLCGGRLWLYICNSAQLGSSWTLSCTAIRTLKGHPHFPTLFFCSMKTNFHAFSLPTQFLDSKSN